MPSYRWDTLFLFAANFMFLFIIPDEFQQIFHSLIHQCLLLTGVEALQGAESQEPPEGAGSLSGDFSLPGAPAALL